MTNDKTARKIGLARAISKLGYCSRSRAAAMIRAGRVSLNGNIRRNPETPVSERDARIAVDGSVIEAPAKTYLMLNKPRGVVTTTHDEKGRETVYGLLGDAGATEGSQTGVLPWFAPVGRLDKASEGLLLLTNDSEWAARIAAPDTHLPKTYHVQIATVADEALLQTLTDGVKVSNCEVLRAKHASPVRAGEKNSWIEIVLDEGKNRQIRRMMEVMGIEVLRLVRVAIGPLQLGDLAKGDYRPLAADEKRMLDRSLRQASR